MKKVRQPKSAHRKTQTPIVAKQISSSGKDVSSHNNLPGPALLPNPQRYCARKKAYLSLRGKHILQLLMKFVWHPNYTTHSFLLQENSEKMLRKRLFCRKTHGRYAEPARAHPPREEGAGRGRGARTAPQPCRLRGRPRKKDGKGENAFPVWSAMFRLSFASSVCRSYGGRDAGTPVIPASGGIYESSARGNSPPWPAADPLSRGPPRG